MMSGRFAVFMMVAGAGCAPRNVAVTTGEQVRSEKSALTIRTSTMHLVGTNADEPQYVIFEVLTAESAAKPAHAGDGAVIFPELSSFLSKGLSVPVVNLAVVQLKGGRSRRVFENPVAIERWDLSLSERQSRVLSFADVLVILARTRDDNGDRKIDDGDGVRLFSYSLASGALKQLSPEGFHITQAARSGDRLILAMVRQQERRVSPDGAKAVSVFESRPNRPEDGQWIVENMLP